MAQVMICAVCQHALDTRTDENGVTLVHSPLDPDDHAVVPVVPGAEWRGRCDFCSGPNAAYVLPARDFRVPGQANAMSRGDWATCDECASLISANRWNEVERRGAAHYVAVHGKELAEDAASGHARIPPVDQYAATIRALHRKLRKNITGPLRRVDEE